MYHLKIVSHRGGQTDYEKARNDISTHHRPAENTLEAFREALEEGADGAELDVVRTKDNKLAVIHSANLVEHVFHRAGEKLGYVGDYTMQELKEKFRVGPRGDGVIPELDEIIDLMAEYHRKGNNVILNIEVKDVKGTDIPKAADNDVKSLLPEYINKSSLPIENIVISSFSLTDIKVLESQGLGVKLAFLCDKETGKKLPLYCNVLDEYYTHFTRKNIQKIKQSIPSLYAIHPEMHTVNEECLKEMKKQGLAIGAWVSSENHPDQERAFLKHLISHLKAHTSDVYIITNFVPEVRQILMDA